MIVTYRADHGTTAAHGAAVVDQRLPFRQFCIGHRLGQAEHLAQLAEQRVFLLPDTAQRFQFVDRRVFRVAGFVVEQTRFGAQSAMHATGEIAGDRCIDHFLEGVDAFGESSAHD